MEDSLGPEGYQDPWDLKEKLALEEPPVPLGLQDFQEHEERGAGQEKGAALGLRGSPAFRDQEGPLDLQVCLGRKVRWVPLESLVTLGKVRLAPRGLLALRVILAPVAPLGFQAPQDNLDPLGLRDLHLQTWDRFFQQQALMAARNKDTLSLRMEGSWGAVVWRCLPSQPSSQTLFLWWALRWSLTNSCTVETRTIIPRVASSPAPSLGSTTSLTTSTAKEATCGWP